MSRTYDTGEIAVEIAREAVDVQLQILDLLRSIDQKLLELNSRIRDLGTGK